jgi:cyclopropane-fatty-acyl-phospholipid synthase
MPLTSWSPLHLLLSHAVRTGNLTLRCAGGVYTYGDGSGPPVILNVPSQRTEWAIAYNPHLNLGEAYMDGRATVEGGVDTLIALLMRNLNAVPPPQWLRWRARFRAAISPFIPRNTRNRAARNVHHHYDAGGEFYGLFLDKDRQYSCAYFPPNVTTLEEAQEAKLRHIAAKLHLNSGQRVLDIGSGWGGLGLYLAHTAGADVTGITLSQEQLEYSRRQAAENGAGVRFLYQDYRSMEGEFDRIVSVGMFEHVGLAHYRTFFQTIARLLAPDGVALLHTIGRLGPPAPANAFILKYIFPGGYLPSLSQILPAIEKARLHVADVEVLRGHYAETLKIWRTRFRARWEEAVALKGESFCRMWEFYLAGSEAAFQHDDLAVFQIQFARPQNALPLTRDYMAEAAADIAYREKMQPARTVSWQGRESVR